MSLGQVMIQAKALPRVYRQCRPWSWGGLAKGL